MHPAALPSRSGQDLGYRRFEPLMGIAGHQAYLAQPAPHWLVQELGSEGLIFGVADIPAQDLTVAVLAYPYSQYKGHRHHRAVLTHLDVCGILTECPLKRGDTTAEEQPGPRWSPGEERLASAGVLLSHE
jgi:hypothetical protein